MNSKLRIAFLWLFVALLTACNYLEPWEYGIIDEKKAFNLTSTLDGMARSAYYYLPNNAAMFDDTSIRLPYMAAASDEAEFIDEMNQIQVFNVGSWNKFSNPDDYWEYAYKGIRIASDYLQGTDTLTWSKIRYSDPSQYNIWINNVCRNRGEMRFLRAYFYFELFKRYNEVPLIKEKVDLSEINLKEYERMPVDSIINFIVDEIDICTSKGKYAISQMQRDSLMKINKGLLPSPYRDTVAVYYSSDGAWADRQTRATLGSALAIKAKALIYAASPQFNSSNDVAKWERALEACKDVIDLTTKYPRYYSLSRSYSELFQTTIWNNEFLFARTITNNIFESTNFPISISRGSTGICPSSNLVDEYENRDGTTFSWETFKSEFNTAKQLGRTLPSPFQNRDQRLAMTIICNMDRFNGVNPIETFVGGNSGPDKYRGSKTGFYLKKFTNQSLDLNLGQRSPHYWTYMRLSDFYLFYSEAMNEVYGPNNKPVGYNYSAVDAINIVRRTGRNDVKMPLIPNNKDKDEFRKLIKHERKIELAFEDARYWDLRRWRDADIYLNGNIYGVRVEKNSDRSFDFNYTKILIEKRVFDNLKMYFYPIPQAEIDKANGYLTQNPNW